MERTGKEIWQLKLERNAKFAARIRAARLETFVGQTELARRIRRPQPFVSALENGKIHVTLADFEDIANALGLNPAALLSPISGNEKCPRSWRPSERAVVSAGSRC
jgi:transcriptional regulator with XRE-family HTH domain